MTKCQIALARITLEDIIGYRTFSPFNSGRFMSQTNIHHVMQQSAVCIGFIAAGINTIEGLLNRVV